MPGHVERFEIIFEKETATFREGDMVTGMVQIVNDQELKYKTIKIELVGTAIVFWGEPDEKAKGQPDGDLDAIKGDCNKEQYFQKVVLLEKEDGIFTDKNPVLEVGEHSFPFSCRLLPELPSTFEGKYGCVRYIARAVVERPKCKSDIVVKRSFTVLSGLNLSFVAEAAAKIEICKYRELGLCCTEGSVTFDWVVEQSGFVSDEDIWIQGSVQNDSKHPVACSMVTLYMLIEYKANKKRKQERKKLASIEKGQTLVDDITVWNDSIHIPRLPPTGLGRCRLIDVRYELEFRAVIEGSSQPIVVTKEIYIGTVPLCPREARSLTSGFPGRQQSLGYGGYSPSMDNFHDNFGELPASLYSPSSGVSRLSLTDLIAATIPATNPSAPLLASLDVVDRPPVSDEDRPPPFAPGHEEKATDRSPPPSSISCSSSLQESVTPPYNPSFVVAPLQSSAAETETAESPTATDAALE